MERFVARCTTCQKDKSRLNPHGLYLPLPGDLGHVESRFGQFGDSVSVGAR